MTKNYEKAYKDRQRGMSYKDIAAKYGVSINTVKSWKVRQWAAMDAEVAEKCAHKEQEKAHKCIQRHYTAEAREKMRERAEALKDKAQADAETTRAAKQMVELKKAHRPPAYGVKDVGKMIRRISDYFLICDQNEKPYTRAGIILALDVDRETYNKYKSGERDYLLEEHITINNIDLETCDTVSLPDGTEIKVDEWGNPLIAYSTIIQKALLRLEEQAEQRLYDKARPGDIFTLKQYGWTDERSPNTVNQTLVIADRDEAQAALQMLYGNSKILP